MQPRLVLPCINYRRSHLVSPLLWRGVLLSTQSFIAAVTPIFPLLITFSHAAAKIRFFLKSVVVNWWHGGDTGHSATRGEYLTTAWQYKDCMGNISRSRARENSAYHNIIKELPQLPGKPYEFRKLYKCATCHIIMRKTNFEFTVRYCSGNYRFV